MDAKQTRNPADRAVASIQAAGPRLARISMPTAVTPPPRGKLHIKFAPNGSGTFAFILTVKTSSG
jgi:hypothetical protein